MLSNKQITKFQMLYKNRFGKEISRKEACKQGARLIRLFELVYNPTTEKEYQKFQKHPQGTKN